MNYQSRKIGLMMSLCVALTVVPCHLAYAATNLALGKPAIANSAYPGFAASNAVDGLPDTTAWSAGDHASSADPNWLQVDLEQSRAIDAIILTGADSDISAFDYYAVYFELLGSNDGVVWDQIGTGQFIDPPGVDLSSPLRKQAFALHGQAYRYLKFYSTGGHHWTHVYEMEVLAAAPTGAAVPAVPRNVGALLAAVLTLTSVLCIGRSRSARLSSAWRWVTLLVQAP